MIPPRDPAALLRHMLGNLDGWADQLRTAPAEPDPLAAIVHVRRNIEQTAIGLRRLLEPGPPGADPNDP